MMRTPWRATAAATAVLLLAACTGDGDGGETATEAATPAPTATTPDDADETTEPSGDGETGSETDGSTATTGQAAFEPVSVDFDEKFLDKGVEVTLEGVDVQPDGLFFRVSAFNNSDQTAELAVEPSLVYATDERGEKLRFQPPGDNPTLAFEPGETLTARLAFSGRFQQVPRVAAVWFNYTDDNTPAEAREDVTVVSATFNNLFLRKRAE